MTDLPRATGRYVVLGLLVALALVLALREHLSASPNRGEPDDWMRVLFVDKHEEAYIPFLPHEYRGGFDIDKEQPDEVITSGRALLDDPDASPLAATIAHADEHGYGFVLLDLRDGWDLSALDVEAPPGSTYAVIGIGDVARHGTRVSFGAPETGPFVYMEEPSGRDMFDVTGVQLALFNHPDLCALFDEDIDGPIAKRARWALDQGMGREARRKALRSQQERLPELDELWPSEPPPGNLAGRWEHVRAAPVRGGIVVEVRPIWLDVSSTVAAANLRSAGVGELAFVPTEALEAGVDLVAARRPCVGIRERDSVEDDEHKPSLDVSPDGRSLVLHRSADLVDVYRFVSDSSDLCTLEPIRSLTPPEHGLPKPNNSGDLARVYSGAVMWWVDTLGQHPIVHRGATPESGLGWLGDNLLVSLSERERETNSAIMLLHTNVVGLTDSHLAPRALLDTHALFPKLDRADPAMIVLDLHPTADDTLLVLTKACPASHALGEDRLRRRCLHRVRFRAPLGERLGREAMNDPIALGRKDIVVQTLGPIDSYTAIAIAAEGTRAVYVGVDADAPDEAPGLFSVEITQTGLGPIERITNVHARSLLRISADGRVVVVEGPVMIAERAERTMARAFVLAPRP